MFWWNLMYIENRARKFSCYCARNCANGWPFTETLDRPLRGLTGLVRTCITFSCRPGTVMESLALLEAGWNFGPKKTNYKLNHPLRWASPQHFPWLLNHPPPPTPPPRSPSQPPASKYPTWWQWGTLLGPVPMFSNVQKRQWGIYLANVAGTWFLGNLGNILALS